MTNSLKKNLIVIAGPTASGKTNLAIYLAQELKTEIISADSRQFYKELTIGTAKPSESELKEVPHHFINNKSIAEDYSVGKYEEEVLKKLEELFAAHDTVILVGGSGLFIKAVCEGFDSFPDINKSVRENFNQIYEERGITPLQEQLQELDPVYYEQVDLANSRRIIRALEVTLSTKTPYSKWLSRQKKARSFNIIKIGLELEKPILHKRIDTRVDAMIKNGLVKEAKNVSHYRNLNALQTVGYKELFEYFDGQYSLSEAVEKIKINTRKYAKRQMTWFRKDKDINWFNAEDKGRILDFLREKLKNAQTGLPEL